MNEIEKYYDRAREFAKQYQEDPSNHIIDIMTSVMMTRDGVMSGGSFVHSILENDLLGSINRGDSECHKYLKLIVATKHYCFLK